MPACCAAADTTIAGTVTHAMARTFMISFSSRLAPADTTLRRMQGEIGR
jgi:hypothetical protein